MSINLNGLWVLFALDKLITFDEENNAKYIQNSIFDTWLYVKLKKLSRNMCDKQNGLHI